MKTQFLVYPLFILCALTVVFTACKEDSEDEEPTNPNVGTVTDGDGNSYQTIKIGDQWWMAENLKTTSFRNGQDIPNLIGSGAWASTEAAGYCNFDNDSANGEVYGHLYNYYSTMDGRKICPVGWHAPNDDDWTKLVQFLGGQQVAGGKLKQTGTNLWNSPNADATNEYGFSALPGGSRSPNEGFYAGLGTTGSWWSTTAQTAERSYVWGVTSANGAVNYYDQKKNSGLSVRCVKD